MNKKLVLYHYPCNDGLMSAAIVLKYFKENNIDGKFYQCNYNQELDREIIESSGNTIYMVDFSLPRDLILNLQKNNEVIILDHHKTAQEALLGLKGAFFDMNKSGATMTWNYFYPDLETPYCIKLVEDRDLWRWQLADTKEFSNALFNLVDNNDLGEWVQIIENPEYVYSLINSGSVIAQVSDRQVESQLKKVYFDRLPNKNEKVPFLNTNHLISETATAMYEKYTDAPYVVIWSQKNENLILVSLRSSTKGSDVSAIAKEYEGGGHYHASGCSFTILEWTNK